MRHGLGLFLCAGNELMLRAKIMAQTLNKVHPPVRCEDVFPSPKLWSAPKKSEVYFLRPIGEVALPTISPRFLTVA